MSGLVEALQALSASIDGLPRYASDVLEAWCRAIEVDYVAKGISTSSLAGAFEAIHRLLHLAAVCSSKPDDASFLDAFDVQEGIADAKRRKVRTSASDHSSASQTPLQGFNHQPVAGRIVSAVQLFIRRKYCDTAALLLQPDTRAPSLVAQQLANTIGIAHKLPCGSDLCALLVKAFKTALIVAEDKGGYLDSVSWEPLFAVLRDAHQPVAVRADAAMALVHMALIPGKQQDWPHLADSLVSCLVTAAGQKEVGDNQDLLRVAALLWGFYCVEQPGDLTEITHHEAMQAVVYDASGDIIAALLHVLQAVPPSGHNYSFAVLLLAHAVDASGLQVTDYECPADAVVHMLAAQRQLRDDSQWGLSADDLASLLVHSGSAWQHVAELAASPHSREQVGHAAADAVVHADQQRCPA
jgi:hypothetical protein